MASSILLFMYFMIRLYGTTCNKACYKTLMQFNGKVEYIFKNTINLYKILKHMPQFNLSNIRIHLISFNSGTLRILQIANCKKQMQFVSRIASGFNFQFFEWKIIHMWSIKCVASNSRFTRFTYDWWTNWVVLEAAAAAHVSGNIVFALLFSNDFIISGHFGDSTFILNGHWKFCLFNPIPNFHINWG